MSGTSTRSYAFLKSVSAHCEDHCEFDQATYIKECLHGGMSGRPLYEDGVCCALSTLLVEDWLNSGTFRRDLVDQFVMDCNELNSVHPTAARVMTLTEHFDQGRWQEVVFDLINAEVGLQPESSGFYRSVAEIRHSLLNQARDNPTFVAIGGLATNGHAIAVQPSALTVFDPNVGYYRATEGGTHFSDLLTSLFALYPADAPAFTAWVY